MARIPENTINYIRQNTNIVDVIGQYVQLKKSGQNHFAQCPFHEDNTPSFSVNEKKQIFACFSCKRAGNVFKFIQEIDGLSFPESVFKVAEIENIQVDQTLKDNVLNAGIQPESFAGKLYKLHEQASNFYSFLLLNGEVGEEAYNYLLDRGLTEETIKEFNLGYSPDQRNALSLYLENSEEVELTEDQLEQSGIFSDSSQTGQEWLDRFSSRIIFPIKDIYGNTVAFSGRDFSKDTNPNFKRAKYLNSPETPIFNKNKVLYNYSHAKNQIRKEQEVVLFEGYMDVISAWQAGVQNGIASMGTSLTPNQIKAVEKITDKLVLAFDGDEAGIEATKRNIDYLVENSDLQIEVVTFPSGLDPDEFIKSKGADAFTDFVRENRDTFMTFLMNYHRKHFNLDNEAKRLEYINVVLEELTKVSSAIERDLYINQLADKFNLSVDSLNEQLHQLLIKQNHEKISQLKYERDNRTFQTEPPSSAVFNHNVEKKSREEITQEYLLNRLLNFDEAWYHLDQLDPDFKFENDDFQDIYILYNEFRKSSEDINDFIDYLKEDELKGIVTNLLFMELETEPSFDEIADYIHILNQEYPIQTQIDTLKDELEQAKRAGDKKKVETLTINIIDLYRELKNNQ